MLLQPRTMGINASKLAAQADFNNNRVNLYVINIDGLLVTYHVDGFGKWAGADLFPGGLRFDRQSGITAGPRYGTTITDVFAVTCDGSLSVIPLDLPPNESILIGFGFPPEAYLATDQQNGIEGTLLAAVNNDGAITVTATGTTGSWGGPNPLSEGSLFKPGAGVAMDVYHTETLADDATVIYAVDNAGAVQVFIVRKDVDA